MKPLYLFDMGGVVASNVHVLPELIERLGVSEEEFFEVCGSPGGWASSRGMLEDLQTGALGSQGFWDEWARRGRARPAEDLWRTCFRPGVVAETVALIEELRREFRVVCATNTLDAHYEVHLAQGDYRCFDAVYASHRLGVAKPSPEFWVRILAAEGRRASEAVFVDDLEANVEAARTLGLGAHRFTSAEALRAELSFEPCTVTG